MIFPDVNLLIYAYDRSFPHQARCASWLESVMRGSEKVCFSWHTILGFIRITTTPHLFKGAFLSKAAVDIAAEMLAASNSIMIAPGERHFSIFHELVIANGIFGPKISDAHVAALAIEHGVTLASADHDFRLFKGLKYFNPLLAD